MIIQLEDFIRCKNKTSLIITDFKILETSSNIMMDQLHKLK